MTEQELYDHLFNKLCDSKDARYAAMSKYSELDTKGLNEKQRLKLLRETVPNVYEVEAYAELAKDLDAGDLGVNWKAKTTVRIVMCSRMGDLGLTRRLGDQYGYDVRVNPGDGYLMNCRLTKKRQVAAE